MGLFGKLKSKKKESGKPDNSSAQGRSKFYKLQVSDIRKETEDTVSVAFDIPSEIENDFKYIQGQYINLRFFLNGEELRRSYSLCSSPLVDKEHRIAVKKVEDGKVSTYINEELKVGDEVEAMSPEGNFFTELSPSQKKRYIAFAAGSGITPVISIVKTILNTELSSSFILYYGNKNISSIIFNEELKKLQQESEGRLKVINILSKEDTGESLLNGRITSEKCESLIKADLDTLKSDEFFLCGPEEMIAGVSSTLQTFGVKKEKIHFELFTSPTEKINTLGGVNEQTDDSSFEGTSEVTIIIDGEKEQIQVDTSGDTILETALEAGIDAPYSCKGAVCSTCKAKVIEGKVDLDANYVLSDKEVEEGYIVTCQSHPKTSSVVISYDE